MFNVGGGEVLVILLVALIVLGPDKLPGAVRKVGEVVGEIRKVSSGFQAEMRTAMLDAEAASRRSEAHDAAEPHTPEEPSPAPAGDADARDGGAPERETPNPGNQA